MFESEAGRERWTARFALFAVAISVLALVITFLQWKSAERAANVAEQARLDAKDAAGKALAVAEQARLDANTEAERQRSDAQTTLAQQRKDSLAALAVQTKRADRANTLADRSAKAAEDAARAAALQVEVADRPRLSFDVVVTGPLEFRPEGLMLTTDVTFKNSGRSPTTDFTLGGELTPMGASDTSFSELSERERVCKDATGPAGANPYAFATLFPRTAAPPRTVLFGSSAKFTVEEALRKGNGKLIPVLIACATYHTAYSSSVHQTAVVLGVFDVGDPPDLVNYRVIIPSNGDKTLPPSRLLLKPLRGIGGTRRAAPPLLFEHSHWNACRFLTLLRYGNARAAPEQPSSERTGTLCRRNQKKVEDFLSSWVVISACASGRVQMRGRFRAT